MFDRIDPEPRVIAEATTSFQHNTHVQVSLSLSPLRPITVPCITMVGTRPTPYKVPVTTESNDAVIRRLVSSRSYDCGQMHAPASALPKRKYTRTRVSRTTLAIF